MKYPIGIQDFDKIINEGYAYVDKTALIYKLVTEGSIYFLSRPRRFGKSLLVSTLKNYFQGKKELFKGLAIDSLEKEWTEYPVFHLSFGGENFLKEGTLDKKLENAISGWEEIYGTSPHYTTLGNRFIYVLKAAHQKHGKRAVVLIDEYDKPLLDVIDTNTKVKVDCNELLLEDHNRNLLKGFYSVFKEADADLQFVLLTGVTQCWEDLLYDYPAFDISLDSSYNSLCGYSTEDLLNYFSEPIAELSKKYNYKLNQTIEMLHTKYGGYHFDESTEEIHNPYSVLSAFSQVHFNDFWIGAFDPKYLIKLMLSDKKDLNHFVEQHCLSYQFCCLSSQNPQPLPLLYQYGCLTIQSYDINYEMWKLVIPNDEVKNGITHLLEWYKPLFNIQDVNENTMPENVE